MKLFDHIPLIQNFIKTRNSNFYKKTPSGFKFYLNGNRSYRFEAGIRDLENAILRAKDDEFPSREVLYTIYESCNDLHVKSQMRTAVFKVISQPWVIVDQKGKPQKSLTELLKKKWFDSLNKHIIETEFWGHSLIYFSFENHEITHTKLFPRMHVSPEKQSLIPDLSRPDKLISYVDNNLFESVFIEVGHNNDLGLFQDIMRHCILKTYSLKDWARSSEKWGDPHVILQSASQNEHENDEKEAFLKNFGNNGYAIIDKDDDVKLLERSAAGNSHHIFLDFIKLHNEESSKGINGQVATADENAFVGSAEVQERILNDYTKSRLRSLMYFHNEITLPFLINYNQGQNVYQDFKNMKWMPKSFMEEEQKTSQTLKEEPQIQMPQNSSIDPFG